MATTTSPGLSRVTVVAPHSRVDLALPSDVALADMLPTLLRYTAEGADSRVGWTLSRLGGVALDGSRTPAQLEIRDGELLYLRPRGAEAPNLVFDDVVDAVATGTQERTARWRPSTTRTFGVILGVVALLAGAVAVLFAGPPQLVGGLVGLIGAVGLLVTATILSRAMGDSRTAVVFGLVSLVYAAVGGLVIAAGDRDIDELGAPHFLIAASALLVATAIAIVGIAEAGPVFFGTAICAVALLIAALICLLTDATAAAAAAGVVAVALATMPALPMFSYRLARLPVPSVPSGPEDLKTDTETVDGQTVLAQSERAEAFLASLLGSIAVISGVGAVAIATGGLSGWLLATVLGLLLMARGRLFLARAQRLPMLIAGAWALAVAIAGVFLAGSQVVRLAVVIPVSLGIGVIAISYGLAGAGRKVSPIWGRTLDIIEVLLILAIVPLAAWTGGLYEWVRSLRG